MSNEQHSDREEAALKQRLKAELAEANEFEAEVENSMHESEYEERTTTSSTSGAFQNDLELVFQEVHTVPTGYTPVKVMKKFTVKVAA
jgi:hypothetical protein